ncbi:protein NYNRIN-like [Scyliorhinus torazame]|uniref:protein NYNRIN-like n=1 Tax=Scyliorhinus torazame TaxID=75743 RepID=UPI003B5A7450
MGKQERIEGPYGGKDITLKEGMLFRGDQWIVPSQHHREFIEMAHESPGAGHPGPETTWQRVERVGWWPSLREDARDFCASCLVCATNNPDPKKRKVSLGHIRRVEGPWQSIQIDYIGPLPPAAGGYKYCLVLVDIFTKWVEAFPCRTATATGTARILVREVFSRWGLPQFVESDQGSHFTGQVMQATLKVLGIKAKWHVAYNPQSSGPVERLNRTIKERIRKETGSSPNRWVEILPLVLMGIRASQSRSTGYSPHELMTGRVMRTPIHVRVPSLTEGQLKEVNRDKFAKKLMEQLKEINWQAAFNMGTQHRRNKLLLEPHTTQEWAIGDQVMVRNFARVGAFEPLYAGPYSIVDKASPMVYAVQLPRKIKWFHVNQCKLFDPTRAGKSKLGGGLGVIIEKPPAELTAVGEVPNSTTTQPVARCCPEGAVPKRPTVLQAPSPGTVMTPKPLPVGQVACLSIEAKEAEEGEISPWAWEPVRGRRSNRVSKPPVRWSPSHLPVTRSRSKGARVGGSAEGSPNPVGEGAARGSPNPREGTVWPELFDQTGGLPPFSGAQF